MKKYRRLDPLIVLSNLLFVLAIYLGNLGSVWAFTVVITDKELQEKLTAKMPLVQKKLALTATLSAPVLELKGSTNQVCFVSDVAVVTASNLKADGDVYVCGALLYKTEEGSFFLNHIQLISLDVKNLPQAWLPVAKEIVSAVVVNSFSKTPIYTFSTESFKSRMAKSTFKSVKVTDSALLINFEIF
jgi:hypothetical protein